jgi:LuxR family maltose regulon positive regulatory protein
MTEELAATLTGRSDAGTLLRELCANNFFVSSAGNGSYRYHHLFLDYLRGVLRGSGMDEAALNKIAAEYYLAVGQHFVASRHAINSNDIQVIMQTVHRFYQYASPSLSEHLHYAKLFFSQDSISEAMREQYPFLYVGMTSSACLSGDAKGVEYYVDKLRAHIEPIARDYPQFLEIAIGEISLDHRVPFSTFLERVETLPPITQRSESIPGPSMTGQAPFLHRSSKAVDKGVWGNKSSPYWASFGENYKVFYPCLMSGLHLEKNLLAEAMSFAEEAVNASGRAGPEFIFSAHMHLAAVHFAMGNGALAFEIIGATEKRLAEMGASHLNHNLMAYQTLLRLWDGDKTAAQKWPDNYFVTKADRLPLHKVFQHFTTARAFIILGRVHEAMSCLLELERFGTDFRRPLDLAEAGTLRAALEWATGKRKEAVTTLETVLAAMQPHGFTRIVASEGAAIEPVLRRIAAKVDKDGYDGVLTRQFVIDTLLIACSVAKKHRGITANVARGTKQVHLSKQQKKMVEFLAAGYKNQKIAEITGLAVITVKVHLKLAYRKLGVNNAIDAVLKAKEMGFI